MKVIARASTGLASQGPSGTFRNSENQDYAFVSPSWAVPCYHNRPYDELYSLSLYTFPFFATKCILRWLLFPRTITKLLGRIW